MKRLIYALIPITLVAALIASEGCMNDVGIDYPPTLELNKPTRDQVFMLGDSIEFQCTASDPGYGTLDGESVRWVSDLEGEIGIGQKFGRKDLNAGLHSITITATDSMNNWATLDFSITIQ